MWCYINMVDECGLNVNNVNYYEVERILLIFNVEKFWIYFFNCIELIVFDGVVR